MKQGFVELEVSQLVKAPYNYKSEHKEMTAKLKANIEKNGFIQNLIVRELETGAFEVINGNHRYDVLVDMQIEKAMCFNLGEISEKKAKRIAIETNETAFPNDMLLLADTLRDISKEFSIDDLLGTLPYTEKQLNKLLQLDTWATVQDSPKGDGETILLKIPMSQDQMEQWNEFKAILGTDNDTSALLKAVESFIQK